MRTTACSLPRSGCRTVRWFLPKDRVLRRYLNPDLVNQERDETQSAMDLYLRTRRHLAARQLGRHHARHQPHGSRPVEVPVRRGVGQRRGGRSPAQRSGRLHIDFGYIDEDGFWPGVAGGGLLVGEWEKEDTNGDAIFNTPTEDIGLDGLGGNVDDPRAYGAEYEATINGIPDAPFPRINNTGRNIAGRHRGSECERPLRPFERLFHRDHRSEGHHAAGRRRAGLRRCAGADRRQHRLAQVPHPAGGRRLGVGRRLGQYQGHHARARLVRERQRGAAVDGPSAAVGTAFPGQPLGARGRPARRWRAAAEPRRTPARARPSSWAK